MKALFGVALLLVGCAVVAPTPAPSYQGGSLIIDNRGAPAFNVVINGTVAVTVRCKAQPSLEAGVNAPPLPWDLTVVRASDQRVLLTQRVDSLPKWLVAFDSTSPMYLGGPVLGPVGPSCPPDI
jgi:hypothetical protein